MSKWEPRDYAVLICVTSACLCLLILVGGVMLGALSGRISLESLGKIQGVAGSGLLGLALILFWVIRRALQRG
jgi:FtsH-binding integral membrane protein